MSLPVITKGKSLVILENLKKKTCALHGDKYRKWGPKLTWLRASFSYLKKKGSPGHTE